MVSFSGGLRGVEARFAYASECLGVRNLLFNRLLTLIALYFWCALVTAEDELSFPLVLQAANPQFSHGELLSQNSVFRLHGIEKLDNQQECDDRDAS